MARPLLVVYLAFLVWAVLSPGNETQSALVVRATQVLVDLGLSSELLTFDRVEVLANVAIIVPAGALAALSFPRLGWTQWAAYGFLAALSVELVQGFWLPQRQASATDVVANTLGALVGALLVSVVRRLSRRR